MSDVSGALGASKPQARSRISNGSKFLQGVDGRTTWARRARDVHAQLVADRGGPDAVSEAETLIARRAAVLEAELERMEEVFASAGQAEPEDLGLYQTCANTQRRLLETVGLERRARDVTSSLGTLLDQAARPEADAPQDAQDEMIQMFRLISARTNSDDSMTSEAADDDATDAPGVSVDPSR